MMVQATVATRPTVLKGKMKEAHQSISEDSIRETLKGQEDTDAVRVEYRDSNSTQLRSTDEVILTFTCRVTSQIITVAFKQYVPIRYREPTHCYQCCGYGYGRRYANCLFEARVYRQCGKEGHISKG